MVAANAHWLGAIAVSCPQNAVGAAVCGVGAVGGIVGGRVQPCPQDLKYIYRESMATIHHALSVDVL